MAKPFPVVFLCLQRWLCCTRFSTKKKILTRAHSKLDSHLDIVKLIKRSMVLDSIFSVSFTKVERHLARRSYRSRVLDPELSLSGSDTKEEEDIVEMYKNTTERHKFLRPLLERSYRHKEIADTERQQPSL